MLPEPRLVPRPRSVRLRDGLTRAGAPIANTRDADLRDGEYRLSVRSDEIEVRASGESGERAARATIAQLQRQYFVLPCLEIEDWPDVRTRGFMLDVSRCRVPTMESLAREVRLLSKLKLNHFQLYTEHTFAYRDHESVWRDASPITHEEVRRLDGWCAEFGIELAANQNCFGHLTPWLVHQPYAELAETHGEYEFYGIRRSGPFSLCPIDAGSLEFVTGLLDELVPCFRSTLVNIGCDETADVGQGRSRESVARLGKAAVYGDFVSDVAAHVIARGRRPMFWADIALSYPEVFDRLPAELISLVWGYEEDSPFGACCELLRSRGRSFWLCPGLSGWRSFAGRTSERIGNLSAAAQAIQAFGADGWMATEWGDLGHRQVGAVTRRALADAASFAWCGEAADPEAVDLHVFGRPGVSRWLDALGDVDLELRGVCGYPQADKPAVKLANASVLFDELHPPRARKERAGTLEQWERTLERTRALEASAPASGDDELSMELRHAAACCRLAAGIAVRRRGGVITGLPSLLGEVIRQHETLWRIGSRPGGLKESRAYWDALEGEVL